MHNPILSICIPTRNRAQYLYNTLFQITKEKIFLNSDKIQIVISDNNSDDNTQDVCMEFKNKFPDKIVYIRQTTNIADKNFIEVIKHANGKYAKLNNDTLSFNEKKLGEFVSILKKTDKNVIFLPNNETKDNKIEITNFETFDDFINKITYNCTWIGGLCVKREKFLELKDPDRFSHLQLAQVDIIARLANMEKNSITAIEGKLMSCQPICKGGYNICEIFGKQLINIMQILVKEELLSKKVYHNFIKQTLLKHINKYHFDYHKKYSFKKGGYFKYLFKYYKTKPYFYLNYLRHLFIVFLQLFLYIKQEEVHKVYVIFGFLKFKLRRTKYNWRKNNKHNHTTVNNSLYTPKVIVGNATYGQINPLFAGDGPEKLFIGNYCSIGPNVTFIVSSEHPYKGLSTYPFKVYYLDYKYEAASKGNIVLNDDVWVGANAIILSGVTVGQGAIIGAGSVISKNVPPYAIVAGNPAKIIKYRFEPEIIERLLKFDFSNLTDEKIKKLGVNLYNPLTHENVDEIINIINDDN